jgi:hypothetical protein
MALDFFVDTGGGLQLSLGRDEDLDTVESFVLQHGHRQVAAKRTNELTWRVWERVPIDSSRPLAEAKCGALLGEASKERGVPRVWTTYRAVGSSFISAKPSPYGASSLREAVEELSRRRSSRASFG